MGLVNPRINAIFIHIYKTGGTSYRSLVGGGEIADWHSPAWQVKKVMEEKGMIRLWGKSLKFAQVRNPYDFVISLYHHLHNQKEHIFHSAATGSLDEFVFTLATKYFKKSPFNGYEFFNTQYYWVSQDEKIIVDRVFKFESMAENIAELSKLIGTENKNIHLNKSKTRAKGKDFKKVLSKKSIEIINAIYDDDFKHFGYKKIK